MYKPSEIRTQNMLPDRSTDRWFDPEEAMTQQQFQKECDINYIVKQNEATGLLTHVNPSQPRWGDFGDAEDYQTSLNQVMAAQAAFMELPAETRAKFDNDPAKLLAFVSNPENASELVKLGLANPVDVLLSKDEKPAQNSSEVSQA